MLFRFRSQKALDLLMADLEVAIATRDDESRSVAVVEVSVAQIQ